MKVELDENITLEAVPIFAAAGHDVHTVGDEGLVGHSDANVWAACIAERRMLVIFDLGFGDVRAYPPGSHAGIVLLRLADQRPAAVLSVLHRFVTEYDLDELAGQLTVLTGTMVRLRRE